MCPEGKEGGFGWKGKAHLPGLVDQLSDYLSSIRVHRRNSSSLASSVACWSTRNYSLTRGGHPPAPSSLYPDSDTTTPDSHEASNNVGLFRYFGSGGASHRLRTNLLFQFIGFLLIVACMILHNLLGLKIHRRKVNCVPRKGARPGVPGGLTTGRAVKVSTGVRRPVSASCLCPAAIIAYVVKVFFIRTGGVGALCRGTSTENA